MSRVHVEVRCVHVRCRNCGGRRTLGMPLLWYRSPGRVPRCRHCGKRDWRHDLYRERKEVGAGAPKPCRCLGYSFPHAKGRGWCEHNAKLSEEDLKDRWESGFYR